MVRLRSPARSACAPLLRAYQTRPDPLGLGKGCRGAGTTLGGCVTSGETFQFRPSNPQQQAEFTTHRRRPVDRSPSSAPLKSCGIVVAVAKSENGQVHGPEAASFIHLMLSKGAISSCSSRISYRCHGLAIGAQRQWPWRNTIHSHEPYLAIRTRHAKALAFQLGL